jgi:hypothetical protein
MKRSKESSVAVLGAWLTALQDGIVGVALPSSWPINNKILFVDQIIKYHLRVE